MKFLLDASVALAAAGQRTGASRAIFGSASASGWELLASNYVLQEIAANLHRFPPKRSSRVAGIGRAVIDREDLTCFNYAAVFNPGKDRPVVFTAAG